MCMVSWPGQLGEYCSLKSRLDVLSSCSCNWNLATKHCQEKGRERERESLWNWIELSSVRWTTSSVQLNSVELSWVTASVSDQEYLIDEDIFRFRNLHRPRGLQVECSTDWTLLILGQVMWSPNGVATERERDALTAAERCQWCYCCCPQLITVYRLRPQFKWI